jgi:hypothetical protein
MGLNVQVSYSHKILYSCMFVTVLFHAEIEIQYIAIIPTLATYSLRLWRGETTYVMSSLDSLLLTFCSFLNT